MSRPEPIEPFTLNVQDVARIIGKDAKTIKQMADSHPLDPDHLICLTDKGADGRKLRKFRRSDIEAWLERRIK